MSSEQSFPLAASERTPDDSIHPLSGTRYRSLLACEAILDHLSREVLATLALMEPLARREFGNTNYNILITTAERARDALARTEAAFKPKNDDHKFADPGLTIIEDDPQETAGDEFACLDANTCSNDGGCEYLTCCGVTKCRYCGTIVA